MPLQTARPDKAYILIYASRIIVARLDRSGDVGVDPERPQCVIQVEDKDLRQEQPIVEGGWGGGGVLERRRDLLLIPNHSGHSFRLTLKKVG
jgi:hypothetical protein